MKRALVGAVVFGLAVSCSAAREEPIGDAGVAQPEALEGRALRRKLREERLELPATIRRTRLPFAPAEPMSSPFAPPPARDIIEPPTAATGPSTFLLAAPIAPLPDHSGRYAIRGRDSTVSFTPHGFAISLAGGTRREPLARHVSATIVGSKDVAPLAEHERRDKVHHYVGDPSKWQRDMPTYGQLAWEEIRPGVDM
ncbi:MAG: DUF7948 domain-containing protein, partial [Polyangiales bacterium]